MVDVRARRRRGAARSRSLGVAVSLLAHLAFLAMMVVGLKRAETVPSTRGVDVELVPSFPAAQSPETRPGQSSPAQVAKAEPKRIMPPPVVAPRRNQAANPAPPPVGQAPTALPPATAGALASALRGSVGCDHADLLGLSPAERERCRERFATTGTVPADLTALEGLAWVALSRDGAAGMDPAKRAAFDAAWKADHSPQHMAAIGCFMRFGGGKVEWLHPTEGFKLGHLPCYFITPKATLAADAPAAQK